MTANKASAHAELDPDFEANSVAPINFIPYLHYELRSRLGKSAMSEVYEAWDTKLCRSVAIKKLKNNDNSSPDTLIDEARTAASLQHAAFIKIHAIEDDDEGHSIVMELAHGTPLKDWIKLNLNKENPENNEARALGIAAQIAEALQEAHAIGLIHGDLKPAKLLIDSTGKIRILDTGLASNNNPNEVATVGQIDPEGSIAYMAPERFANPVASAASDIYALGTMLYEILTGSTPYAQLHGLALIAAQVQSTSEQWPWPNTISTPVRQLIQAMTTRQPDQRLSSAQVVEECKKLGATEPHSNSAASINLSALQAELANTIHQQKKRKFVIGTILAMVLIGISAVGAWQAKPYWPQIVKALTPYSEAREMELGIAALVQHSYNLSPKQLETASAHFEGVLSRKPEYAKAVGYMSLVYFYRYQSDKRDEIWLQKAKASVQQVLRLESNLAVGKIANAKMLIHHNKLGEALVSVDQALSLEPNNIFAWHTKMTILLLGKKFDDALKFADEGAHLFPHDRFLLELKGAVLNQLGRYSDAERPIRLALERQPDSSNGYSLLSIALQEQGRISEALQILQHGLQIRPSAHLYSAFGNLKFSQGDYLAAANAFESAISTSDGVAGSYLRWYLYAEALMWVPSRQEAGLKAYRKASELLSLRLDRSPNDARLLVFQGLFLSRLSNREQSLSFTERALKVSPDDEEILFFAALSHELLGQRDAAITEVNKAIALGKPLNSFSHPILTSLRKDLRFNQQ